MVMKQCRLCRRAQFMLDFSNTMVLCKNCTKHVDMAYEQIAKCIQYFTHFGMDEIAKELGIPKSILTILSETGQLQALQDQHKRKKCPHCQRTLQDEDVCTKCMQPSTTSRKVSSVNQQFNERRRQHQLKQQLLSTLSNPSKPSRAQLG